MGLVTMRSLLSLCNITTSSNNHSDTAASSVRTSAAGVGSDGSNHHNHMHYDCGLQANASRAPYSEDGSIDALMYIVVVLLFYAFSIVVLMVKYIRRENKEAYLGQYFDEFVARERFQTPLVRNQMQLQQMIHRQTDPDIREHLRLCFGLEKSASVVVAAAESLRVNSRGDPKPAAQELSVTCQETTF